MQNAQITNQELLQVAIQANNPLDRELKRAGEGFKAFSKKNEEAIRELWEAIELLQRENAELRRELSSQKRAEATEDPSNGPFTRGLAEALKEDQEEQLLFREKAEKKFSWIKNEFDYLSNRFWNHKHTSIDHGQHVNFRYLHHNTPNKNRSGDWEKI